MIRRAIALIVVAAAMAASLAEAAVLPTSPPPAQDIGVKFDFKTGNADPVASFKIFEFDTLLSFQVRTEIIGFAGARVEDGRLIGGGAWVYPFPLASGTNSLWAYLGPSLEFDTEGRPWRFGFVFGVRY